MIQRRGARPTGRVPVSRQGGLLPRFIADQLAHHVEPTRRGTPRGTPVGFSQKKLAAALSAMTSADVKWTARDVGVPYGVVRKWRTEEPFKELVERLEDEFVEDFCARVDADLGVHGPLRGASVPEGADLEQVADAWQARRDRWVASHLGDAALYGPRLIGKLTRHLLDQREGVGRPWRLSVLHAISTRWARAGTPAEPLWPGLGGDASEVGVHALLGMLRFVVLTLESGRSEDHRRLALVYLKMLHRQLGGGEP